MLLQNDGEQINMKMKQWHCFACVLLLLYEMHKNYYNIQV